MVFLLIETGAMITAYHSSVYVRRINALSIFLGGLGAAANEFRKKNGRLLLAVLGNYILINFLFSGAYPDPYETGEFCII